MAVFGGGIVDPREVNLPPGSALGVTQTNSHVEFHTNEDEDVARTRHPRYYVIYRGIPHELAFTVSSQ
ncbi:MAG: hypothetical protein JXA33_25605 [Anaerolineae bacterium]|nr:hypothetical protein [Anaerolineae bacterium]